MEKLNCSAQIANIQTRITLMSLMCYVSHRKWRVWTFFHPRAWWHYFSFGFQWKEGSDALWSTRESSTHTQVWRPPLSPLLLFTPHYHKLAVLMCFSWYVNRTEIDAEADYRYSVFDGNLIINNASVTSNYGLYQCKVENSFGTILSREALLQFACEYRQINVNN